MVDTLIIPGICDISPCNILLLTHTLSSWYQQDFSLTYKQSSVDAERNQAQ
jgi:hypothetical protein